MIFSAGTYISAKSYVHSSHKNVFTGNCVHVLFHVAQELFAGSDTFALTSGLNFSLAMLQEDYGAYVAASLG
jgi:hypothetical protein